MTKFNSEIIKEAEKNSQLTHRRSYILTTKNEGVIKRKIRRPITCFSTTYKIIIICFLGFYGISNFVDFLMPNPFFKKSKVGDLNRG